MVPLCKFLSLFPLPLAFLASNTACAGCAASAAATAGFSFPYSLYFADKVDLYPPPSVLSYTSQSGGSPNIVLESTWVSGFLRTLSEVSKQCMIVCLWCFHIQNIQFNFIQFLGRWSPHFFFEFACHDGSTASSACYLSFHGSV